MTGSIARRLLFLPFVAALGAGTTACTVLGPAGLGGWPEDKRLETVEKAAVTAASAGTGPSGSAPAPRRLDLGTALDLASRYNLGIAASEAGVEAAAGDVAIVRSALLPTATVRGGYNWYSDEQTSSVDIDPSLFPPGATLPAVTVRQKDFANVSAAVRLAIDLSGELRHGLEAAQSSYRAEKARAWASRLDEEKSVAAAYYGLLEAERLREVGGETVRLHEQQLADASSRYQQGRLTRNEVLVVQVALSTARQRLIQLDNLVDSTRRDLNRATGLAVDDATEVTDVTGRPSLPSVEEVVAAARRRNPLVSSLVEEVQAADERLTAARRGRLPRFSANGGYDATTADTLKPNNYGSIGVGVEVDLGSFRREGEIAKLDAAGRRTHLLLQRGVREIEALVRDTHARVRERLAAIDAASEAVVQADENRRIRQVQFDEGRATSEDLLDASELLTRQRAALAAALYQAHARRAELQQLMGEPLATLAEAPAPAVPAVAATSSSLSSTQGAPR